MKLRAEGCRVFEDRGRRPNLKEAPPTPDLLPNTRTGVRRLCTLPDCSRDAARAKLLLDFIFHPAAAGRKGFGTCVRQLEKDDG